ncbi:MAG: cysteine desulfurase [Terrimicrobiaceae bacterium]|nr:cysteine desulfurase [Terrimicrobiaceae bacterium]
MTYLDYNATTPLAPEAREAMLPHLSAAYGNPSSIHAAGRAARAAVDEAREVLAGLLGARPHEIIFTSGGTEACNLAIFGIARAMARAGRGRHLVTAATEHHAVLHAMEVLRDREGFELTVLPVSSDGRTPIGAFVEALRPGTILASVMQANNETGVIQPVEEMAAACHELGIPFHSDAVQSFGKIGVTAQNPGADSLSFAAHKFYGPKGAGFLWLRAGVPFEAVQVGGGHENRRRAGTENVAAIAGMAAAATLAVHRREEETARLLPLREALWEGIVRLFPAAQRNTTEPALANTLSVSFPGLDGEALLIGLDIEGVMVSSGSACMAGSVQVSHVIEAMGRSRDAASATIRFSMGRGTTEADVTRALDALSIHLSRQLAAAA